MFPCVQKLRVSNEASRRTKQAEPAKPESSSNVDRDSTSGVQHVSHEEVSNTKSTNGVESGDDVDSSPELHSIPSASSSLTSSSLSSSSLSTDAADSVAGPASAEPDVAVESSDETAEPVDEASNDNVQPTTTTTDKPHDDDDGSHATTEPEAGRSVILP